MKKLIRKPLDKDYSFNTPGKFLFNNEKFKKFIVDLTDFEKKFEWISECPFRSISEHFHMSYEQMDELIKYLNSFSHEEVSRGLYEEVESWNYWMWENINYASSSCKYFKAK